MAPVNGQLRDRIGCAIAASALLAFGAYLIASSSVARVVVVAVLFMALAVVGIERRKLVRSLRVFRRTYGPRGKDLLLVYSASPHWQPYIEAEWLPRWGDRAVVLNRSAPNWTTRPEAEIWYRMTATGDHTPAAIVIPARGRARLFRFFKAFRDHKHGNVARLKALEAELAAALDRSARGSRRRDAQ